jgi:hypothetical protein
MEVFISYEYINDQAFVDKLTASLKQIGIYPLIINLKLKYGDKVFNYYDRELRNCKHAIVVLSKSYNKEEWYQSELLALLMKEKFMKTNFILPVVIEDCDIPPLLRGRVCDFRNVTFEEGFERLTSLISNSRQVFVVMKFGDKRLDSAYEVVIKPVIEEFQYAAMRIDEIQDSGKINDQILDQIIKSEVVLADLTGERPNSYYEAGYAHALEKEIIFTIQKGSSIHFDLAGYRFIEWETESELRTQLRERFEAIQQRANK